MRTREFDEKKVVMAALQLFWKKGFGETSLADLQHATGLGKASLYNAFESKEGLFQVVLQAYLKEVGTQYDLLLNSDTNPCKALLNLLQGLIEKASKPPRGCLLVLSVQNSLQHSSATKKLFDSAFAVREDKLRKTIAHLPLTNVEIDSLTRSLCVFIDGLLTATRSGAHGETLHKTATFTLKTLMKSLLTKP